MKIVEISVVVPVFNAEDTLDELVSLISQTVRSFAKNYEIILVDDYSPDNSWDKIKSLSKEQSNVFGLKMAKNYGVDKVITAGLAKSKGKYVYIISCDLQDPIKEMKKMYNKITKTNDLDIVCSFYINKHPESVLSKYLSSRYWKIFSFFIGAHYPEEEGLYRLLSRKTVDFYLMHTNIFKHIKILHDTGLKKDYVKMEHGLRQVGKSGYNFVKKIKFAVDYISTYSYLPLIFSSVISFVVSISGFLLSFVFIILKLLDVILIPGWTSIIVVVTFFFSILFFNLSILAIYLSKSIEESKRPNSYFTSEES